MFLKRFGCPPPAKRSLNQLRGIEGEKTKNQYGSLAKNYGVPWSGRDTGQEWSKLDVPNKCISSATACLYGICEAAILATGYSTCIGFLHAGQSKSFVYDIADLFKFDTVIPIAFETASKHEKNEKEDMIGRKVRIACRDMFRRKRIICRIVSAILDIFNDDDNNIA